MEIPRQIKWLGTRHGVLVLSLLLGAACSPVWYWTENLDVNYAFYYLMWILWIPAFLMFIFLMISAGVNYALMAWPNNKPLNWFREKVQFRFNRPFKYWFTKEDGSGISR